MATPLYPKNSTTELGHSTWRGGDSARTIDLRGNGVQRDLTSIQALSTAIGSGVGTLTTGSTGTGPSTGLLFGANKTWMSAPLAADITISGTVTFNICGFESNMSANIGFHVIIWRVDKNGSLTEILSSEHGTEVGTSLGRHTWTGTPTSTAFKKGDRILVGILFNDAGGTMASGHTASMRYGGDNANTADTNVTFTETITFDTTTPAGTTYYLRDTAASISNGRMLNTSAGASAQTAVHQTITGPLTWPGDQWTDTAGGNDVAWYTPPLDAFTLNGPIFINVPSGQAWEAGTGGGSPYDLALVEVAVCDADGSNAVVYGTTYNQAQTSSNGGFYIHGPDTTVAQGQRIRVRWLSAEGRQATVSGTNRTLTYNAASGQVGFVYLTFDNTITEAPAGTNVFPGTGSLVLDGFAPTVQTPRNITPGTGALTLEGFAPTVQTPQNVTPSTGELTLIGFAPTVIIGAPTNVTPGTGSLNLIGFAPTIQTPRNVIPGTGELVFTGFAPIVTIPQNVFPGVGDLIFTGFAPAFSSSPSGVFPGTGQLDLTGFAPTVAVSDHKTVFPGTGNLDLIGFAPTVQTPRNMTPGTGVLGFEGFAPTINVTSHTNVFPGVGSLVFDGFAPVANVGVSANPGTGQLAFAGFAPVVSITDHISVFPGFGELVFAGFAPTVAISSSVNVTPGTGQLVFTGFPPFLVITGGSGGPVTGQLWPRGGL